MKKIIMTAFLGLAGVSHAQSTAMPTFNPTYQKYLSAVGDALPNWTKLASFTSGLTSDLNRGDSAALRASTAYACAVFLKDVIASSDAKSMAGKVVETGDFKGSYPDAQKHCEKRFLEEYDKVTAADFANQNFAYAVSEYLITEKGRNRAVEGAVIDTREALKKDSFNTRFLLHTLAVDIYLTKFPELKEQYIQRSGYPMGKSSDTLNNSLEALAQSTPLVVEYAKKQMQAVEAANKENQAAQQETLNALKTLYIKVQGLQASADQLMKQKKYQDAWKNYVLISTQDQSLRFIKESLKSQNITSPIEVNGKQIKQSDAIATIEKLISTSMQKSYAADQASQKARQAVAAQWKQAAQGTLKGDRLTIFNRFGIPNVLLPGDMYTGDEDIKRSMANIQKATGWQYSFSQTALGGFFCNVRVSFSGNKATSKSISASIVGADADAYCKSNYRF